MPPKLKSFNVSLKLPYLATLEGTWEPDDSERKAAWELYVELVTRIAVQELGPEEGLLTEALNSLYSLFAITREILKHYGPEIAQPKGRGRLSFGFLAISVLNGALRPLLARWHPQLDAYVSRRGGNVSPLEHERRWEHHSELRDEIDRVRASLIAYAELLANVAAVQPVGLPEKVGAEDDDV